MVESTGPCHGLICHGGPHRATTMEEAAHRGLVTSWKGPWVVSWPGCDMEEPTRLLPWRGPIRLLPWPDCRHGGACWPGRGLVVPWRGPQPHHGLVMPWRGPAKLPPWPGHATEGPTRPPPWPGCTMEEPTRLLPLRAYKAAPWPGCAMEGPSRLPPWRSLQAAPRPGRAIQGPTGCCHGLVMPCRALQGRRHGGAHRPCHDLVVSLEGPTRPLPLRAPQGRTMEGPIGPMAPHHPPVTGTHTQDLPQPGHRSACPTGGRAHFYWR